MIDSKRPSRLSLPSEDGLARLLKAAADRLIGALAIVHQGFKQANCLRAVADVQFFEDALQVVLDRKSADVQDYSDLRVGFAQGDPLQNFYFATRQAATLQKVVRQRRSEEHTSELQSRQYLVC